MTEDCDDVTRWIGELRQQSPDAQARIFELYFGRATRLAGRRLASSRRREQDEEDIALSAMHSFFAGVAAEQFDRLTNRDDLWAIIAVITSRKAIRQLRRQATQKRGGAANRSLTQMALGWPGWERKLTGRPRRMPENSAIGCSPSYQTRCFATLRSCASKA